MLALCAAVTFFAAVLLGVLEGGLDDPLGAEDRDRLDRDAGVLARGRVELVGEEPAQLLDLLRALLELDARVQVLGVLADDHEVRLGEAGADAVVGLARPDAGVQVELLAERDVDRAVARADRRRGRALDRHAALADRIERAVGERVALGLVDVDPASWKSHSNSTPVASSTRLVASASSGPVPSPGMNVTLYAVIEGRITSSRAQAAALTKSRLPDEDGRAGRAHERDGGGDEEEVVERVDVGDRRGGPAEAPGTEAVAELGLEDRAEAGDAHRRADLPGRAVDPGRRAAPARLHHPDRGRGQRRVHEADPDAGEDEAGQERGPVVARVDAVHLHQAEADQRQGRRSGTGGPDSAPRASRRWARRGRTGATPAGSGGRSRAACSRGCSGCRA